VGDTLKIDPFAFSPHDQFCVYKMYICTGAILGQAKAGSRPLSCHLAVRADELTYGASITKKGVVFIARACEISEIQFFSYQSLFFFPTGNLPKRITFFLSEFAFRLNSSSTANVNDAKW